MVGMYGGMSVMNFKRKRCRRNSKGRGCIYSYKRLGNMPQRYDDRERKLRINAEFDLKLLDIMVEDDLE